MPPKHIFLLPNNLAPYQIARFNALADLELDFCVATIPWEQHLRPWTDADRSIRFKLNQFESLKGFLSDLDKFSSSGRCRTVSVYGYIAPFRKVLSRLKRSNIRRGVFVDAFEPQRKSLIKEAYKAYFLRRNVDFFLVPGHRHISYVAALAPAVETVLVPLCGADQFKESRDVPGGDYFLCVARFSSEKNVVRLIEAFATYRRKGGRKSLHLIGDGPQRTEVAAKIGALGVVESVRMLGWRHAADVSEVMSSAFALVQPSLSEAFGVTIAEGAQSGLPLLVSRNCGSLSTIAVEYMNALTFDPTDQSQIAECMLKLERNPKLAADLRAGSIAISKTYSVQRSARTLFWFLEGQLP